MRKGTWTIIELHTSTKPGAVTWLARCDCGQERAIRASNWRAKDAPRCKCSPKPANYNQLPEGEASFNVLFSGYVLKAKKREISFDLSVEAFRTLTKQPCTYCGKPPSQRRKTTSGTPYIYTGVDRIDPRLGYTNSNVVPCCGVCNRSKSDLPFDEWREHIRVLYERLCR